MAIEVVAMVVSIMTSITAGVLSAITMSPSVSHRARTMGAAAVTGIVFSLLAMIWHMAMLLVETMP